MINSLPHISSFSKHSLDIIIVNWNSNYLLKNCLDSLFSSDFNNIKINVFVVDNGSVDGSEIYNYPMNSKLIKFNDNLGFGKACNHAFNLCKNEFILLLNPDTILEKNTLIKTLNFVDLYPNYAIYGIQQRDTNGNVLRTCGRFPNLKDIFFESIGFSKILPRIFKPAPIMLEWDHLSTREVDHVMGSFMLIRRDNVLSNFLFDENFFMYLEDLDFSFRMKSLNFKSIFISDFYITHIGGGTSKSVLDKRLFYSLSSKVVFQKKHFGLFQAYITIIIIFFLEFPVRALTNIFSLKQILVLLKAYWMLSKNINSILK